MASRLGTIDPSKFPDEEFALYSIPAFDIGMPEISTGKDIGSSKQIVRSGDVLLSRIVPHIRRAWVVGEADGRRQIASGEWIVFRGDRIEPQYLRHVLLGDSFHAQFMRTVSGVGGSLLRARPAYVGKIHIPLPSISEQRRIAEILDKADALRAKRRAVIAQVETLTQSIFLDMFGDPSKNLKSWPVYRLEEAVKEGTIVTYGIVQAGQEFPNGVPYIRTGDIVDGEILADGLRHTDPAIAAKFQRSRVEAGDIVMSIRATVGTTALVPKDLHGANLTQGTARISPGRKVERMYLLHYLRTGAIQNWISRQIKGATFREITLARLRDLPVVTPPPDLQLRFTRCIEVVQELKTMHESSRVALDRLFAALQYRAFRGELAGRISGQRQLVGT